eukprot:gene27677-1966_t
MSSADGNGWILASNAIADPPNDGRAIFKWSPREGDVDGILAEHFEKDGEQRQPTEQMSAGEGARVLRLKPFTPIRLLEVTPRDTGPRRQEEQSLQDVDPVSMARVAASNGEAAVGDDVAGWIPESWTRRRTNAEETPST